MSGHIRLVKCLPAVIIILLAAFPAPAQDEAAADRNAAAQKAPAGQELSELRDQMRELQSTMAEMKAELSRSRAEVRLLREDLHDTRSKLAAGPAAVAPDVSAPSPGEDTQRLARLEEEHSLLAAKVDEQYQTKVEAASKYRVRLSGIILTNIFSNHGAFENQDFPTWAVARMPFESGGSVGATLRQSQLGLEIFGPQIGEAKTRADVQMDFAGGFPSALNGTTFGIVRLRTAAVHLDWQRTAVVAGQDVLFFSPLSPTSLASLAVPAFSYSGNLWSWTPQVRVERRYALSDDSSLRWEGGILDPLTGEYPGDPYSRGPSAGERSRQPGYASRVSWTHRAFGSNVELGAGGYYSRQNWGFHRAVDSWTLTADWSVPFGTKFELTGEFFRGRAVGGLGGGIGRSVLFNGPLTDTATQVRGLDTLGGWAQLKFRPSERWEFNGAFGLDNPFAEDLRRFPSSLSFLGQVLSRNRSASFNFIYRPRSDLLFSTEYRHIRTAYVPGDSESAGQLNLSVGVLF
jgi:hypothetical protein